MSLDNNNTQTIIELFAQNYKQVTNLFRKNHMTALRYQNTNSKNLILDVSNTESLTLMLTKLLDCDVPFIAIDGTPCVINIEPNQLFEKL